MGERTCSIADCNGKVCGWGWCSMHYQRWVRHGDPLVRSAPKPPARMCAMEGCETEVKTATLCKPHYKQRKRKEASDARLPAQALCANCGDPFEYTPGVGRGRKYCTPACREVVLAAREQAARRLRRSVGRALKCAWCDAAITHKRNSAKFCSHECGNRFDHSVNADRVKATRRRYERENRDKVREARQRYYASNREAFRQRGREWREANPERRRAIGRKYYRKVSLERPDQLRMVAAIRSARVRSNGGGPLSISQRDWHRLLVIYRNRCAYCRAPEADLQVEHVVPLARGGRHSLGNVAPVCGSCNRRKNDRLLIEWRYGRGRPRPEMRVFGDEIVGPTSSQRRRLA